MSNSDPTASAAGETPNWRATARRWRDRVAREVLGDAWSVGWLLLVWILAFLVGVRFYVESLPAIPTALWPLYADSPVAVALAALSLATLLPFVAGPARRPVTAVPTNRALAYLHTLAFVWLVKYGTWPAFALNRHPELYLGTAGSLWDYWGIVVTHLLFVLFALLIPAYGRTTRGALATALGLLLVNDVVDYWFGFHPPLRYEPGVILPAVTALLSLSAVLLAAASFARLGTDTDRDAESGVATDADSEPGRPDAREDPSEG
ncbi:MAG: DUF1405 domain-containing protein [Halopenitus sp.]